ncbi:MAG: DUF6498-containing protein [Methanoregula sp.]|nr:DUF6498-containing protein [Methanoregula sp.]
MTPPVISLLFANLVTIVLAIGGHWDVATVMCIYWAQSVIIGIFTVITLLGIDTSALSFDIGRSLKEKGGSGIVGLKYIWLYKCVLAGFFALHYGLFHYGYFSFIVESGLFGSVNFSNPPNYIACGLFFANHLYLFLYHRKDVRQSSTFIAEEFFRPYQRIVPMHLTIIFGSIVMFALHVIGINASLPVLVLFLLLKTYADLDMHQQKHAGEELKAAPADR